QFGTPRAAILTGNGDAPYDPQGDVKQAQYHLLWPNTTINVEFGPGNLSTEEVGDETARAMMEFGIQVGNEDAALVESVQRGLDSGMVPHGRLLLSSAHLIEHFQ